METMDTGDILLFHHKNTWTSWLKASMSILANLIDFFTWSRYSHSAIIIKDPQFTSPPLKGLYVLQSSYEDFPDVENNEYKLGVELDTLEAVLKTWDGNIYWRQLNCTRDAEFYTTLGEAHSVVHNRPYDIIPTDWIKAGLDIHLGNVQKKKTFWCSALCAYIYTQLGFLPKDTPWSLITPKEFGSEKQSTPLIFTNCTLEKEILIK